MSPDEILEELVGRHEARAAEFDSAAEPAWFVDELTDAWRAAQAEAVMAYDEWCGAADADAYVVYRAAQDRADQAQAALSSRKGRA
jgi:hypothetical protein